MEIPGLVFLGADGVPEPRVIPDPLAQVAQVFAGMEARALQSAYPVRFRGFDEDPREEEELEFCPNCSHPMSAAYLDTEGVCEDCRQREIRTALSTPPFARSDEDWALLEKMGYVDPTDDN
jgi:hypothetical protein